MASDVIVRLTLLFALVLPGQSSGTLLFSTTWLDQGTHTWYDCQAGINNWQRAWSTEKMAWCCQFNTTYLVMATDAQTPFKCIRDSMLWSMTTSTTTNPASYDCQAGIQNWQTAWSSDKMAWCCQHDQTLLMKAAPSNNTGFACILGHFTDMPGSRSSSSTSTTTSRTFTTTTTSTSSASRTATSSVTSTSSVTRTTTVSSITTTTTATSVNRSLDCQYDIQNWQWAWSNDKMIRCCQNNQTLRFNSTQSVSNPGFACVLGNVVNVPTPTRIPSTTTSTQSSTQSSSTTTSTQNSTTTTTTSSWDLSQPFVPLIGGSSALGGLLTAAALIAAVCCCGLIFALIQYCMPNEHKPKKASKRSSYQSLPTTEPLARWEQQELVPQPETAPQPDPPLSPVSLAVHPSTQDIYWQLPQVMSPLVEMRVRSPAPASPVPRLVSRRVLPAVPDDTYINAIPAPPRPLAPVLSHCSSNVTSPVRAGSFLGGNSPLHVSSPVALAPHAGSFIGGDSPLRTASPMRVFP